MFTIIFWTLWVSGLVWVSYLIIKAPYMDEYGNYISRKDWKIFERQERLYH